MKMPQDTGTIHFVGIGGIGMSGIAEVMKELGYDVQGSDLSENYNVARLRNLDIRVHIGHKPENVDDAKVVVISSAVKDDNPEVVEARAKHLPVVRRAEMLAELMRFKSCIAVAGTHGKTTTTSLVAALLDAGKFDPTVINGGIINAYGTNARLGKGEWMVVEADESDGTFVKLPADVAIVTNIDPEHLDHYGSFDVAKAAFKSFIENIPFYGFAVMCIDHPEVQALIGQLRDRKIITYGKSAQADVRIEDLHYVDGDSYFSLNITNRQTGEERRIEKLVLTMPGEHNVMNATAAIAVCINLGADDDVIRSGLQNFSGVKRRFTKTGSHNGVTVFDDYGHHPVEITSVLDAARNVTNNKVIAVVQPHRYTRLRDLFDEFSSCFNDADTVIVAPVFEAGESPLEGFDHRSLAEGLSARGHRHVLTIDGPDELAPLVRQVSSKGDIVLCLGAGSISAWANALPEQLAAFDAVIEPAGDDK